MGNMTVRRPPRARDDVRERLVEVASSLLTQHGPDAVTTRAVAGAAGVQAPTIYRLFGDKDGLLDAVVERVAADFVAQKASTATEEAERGEDPLEDLRAAFLHQVAFGVAHPEVFRLLGDDRRSSRSAVAEAGREVLRGRVHRVALDGRLCVEEERCVDLVQSAGAGVIQTLVAVPPDRRDPGLPAAMWDVLRRAIALDPEPGQSVGRARSTAATLVAFRAMVPGLDALSDAERSLLAEWLDRPAPTPEPDR